MCFVLLIICVVGIANGPVGMVFFYEKEVQDKAVELELTTREMINKRTLPILFSPILFFSDLSSCGRKQIDLVQAFSLTELHHFLLQILQILFCEVVFVAGTAVNVPVHKRQFFYIQFSKAVDKDPHIFPLEGRYMLDRFRNSLPHRRGGTRHLRFHPKSLLWYRG